MLLTLSFFSMYFTACELKSEFNHMPQRSGALGMSTYCQSQSFTPTKDYRLKRICVGFVNPGTASGKITLHRFLSTSNLPLLATSNTATLGSTDRCIDFPSTVALTAGNTYLFRFPLLPSGVSLEFASPTSADGGGMFYGCGTVSASSGRDMRYRLWSLDDGDDDSDGVRNCEDACPLDNCGSVLRSYFADEDGDGKGNPSKPMDYCCSRDCYTATLGNDCDDSSTDVAKSATVTYYRDLDNDGYGRSDLSVTGCSAPPGYVKASGDCNDQNKEIYPGATEYCNGLDNDCDGVVSVCSSLGVRFQHDSHRFSSRGCTDTG